MILYIVRHGKTLWNELGLLQGKTDIDLSEFGKKQALLIKNKIDKIDVCISSPLKRAIDTASIIYNGDIIIDDRIIERGFGNLEGKEVINLKLKPYWDYKMNKSDNNVESVQDLFKRCKSFIDDLKNKYSNKTVLVVSHGATVRALNYVINGFNEDDDLLKLDVPNCAVFKYEI